MSKTFIMLKPDAIEREIVGKIIDRIESSPFHIIHIKSFYLTFELINNLYSHHSDKPFFNYIINYMSRGLVIGIIVEGNNVVEGIREIIGPTNCMEADKNTIRGEFCMDSKENIIHSSDSDESAEKEISIFFGNHYY